MQTSDNLLGHLQRTNARLAQAQEQLATGKAVNGPSDAAAKTPAILMLRQQLASAEREGRDLEHARTALDRIDHTLGEANNLVQEAHNHALGEIGLGADAGTRQAAAEEVDATIRAMLDLANTSHQGIALFGGTKGGEAPPFESFLGGIRYNGNAEALQLDGHTLEDQNINGTGLGAFGNVTATVASPNSLQPLAVADTRMADVDGATQEGVNLGQVRVTVDGVLVSVDLTDADKLGDVVNRINNAIDSVDPGAGQLGLAGEGFELTAHAGHAIAIEDNASETARTLGLRLDAAGGTDAGPSVNPRVTDVTRLADLGASIDPASGMQITQGEQTKVADFSNAETVEDLKNTVADLNLGVRLEINGQGSGLNLVNEVSGVALSVGEAGGTTASDLGLRTLDHHTALSEFRRGGGVETVAGENDLAITLKDGSQFEVDLDDVQTVGQLATAVEDAADNAGVNVGAEFGVTLADTGNGIVIEDQTAGGGSFVIESINGGRAAEHLGLAQETTGNTIESGDRAKVHVEGVFTHLMELRDALEGDDESGIALASSRLEEDLDALGLARGRVGIQGQRVEQAQQRLEDRKIVDETMLSDLQDADFAEVITRFVQLQQQLQATLQSGAQNMQMSFFDFLR